MHSSRNRGRSRGTVVLAQAESEPDHFLGVDEALHARGLSCDRLSADQAPVQVCSSTRVVVIKDQTSFVSQFAVQQARRVGACVVLLMDGIVEHRNTFLNSKVPGNFLRPAPADVVACAGAMDQRTLLKLGNDAVATGLPRMRAMLDVGAIPATRSILVATANTPAFDALERRRVLEGLAEIKHTAQRLGIDVRWRLTANLEHELGVECDRRALATVLSDVRVVVTQPSTLLVEAMLANRAAVLMDLHPTPCWQVAPWVWRPESSGPRADVRPDVSALHTSLEQFAERSNALGHALEAALAARPADLERQNGILADMHPDPAQAATNLAALCQDLVDRPRRNDSAPMVSVPARAPIPSHAAPDRPRVVNMVFCDGSPVGGVQTWAMRLAREFARQDRGYDVRTLLVTPHPEALPDWVDDRLHHACVFDPFADHTAILHTVRSACNALDPSIVIPNYTDICYMVANQLRSRLGGPRILAVAHTDHEYYRELVSAYPEWDGGVAVSSSCLGWLARSAGPRPVTTIPCCAPVAEVSRQVTPADRPIQLMYCGRMVQEQKRIFDLLPMIDRLESLGVSYELHMVGDGPELGAWRRALATRELRSGVVCCHGRREPAWVEEFLPSVDLSILVSDYEGTSVSMLEAMGAGVVPCVTRVSSGVDEWVRDGENGIVVPLRSPERMADRIAEAAADRHRLAEMGQAAWQTASAGFSVSAMADAYATLFKSVLQSPAGNRRSDAGLRTTDRARWRKSWVEDAAASERWIRETLIASGYSRIAIDKPSPECDAVLVRSEHSTVSADEVAAWRARGLGVAFSPYVCRELASHVAQRALRGLMAEGCERIAFYGVGRHTRQIAPVFYMGYPIVGLIDDRPPPSGEIFGLPVVTLGSATESIRPDGVILSSDAWEAQMWERTRDLRAQGVRVVALYGEFSDAAEIPIISA